MTKPFRRKIGRDSATVWVAKPDRMALLGAAYLSTESAYVALDKDAVVLWPKKGRPAASADLFEKEYLNQLSRWAVARKSLTARAGSVARMLAMGERLAENASTLMPELEPEKRSEIEKLLKEAEAEPRDPLGISRPWEETRKRA